MRTTVGRRRKTSRLWGSASAFLRTKLQGEPVRKLLYGRKNRAVSQEDDATRRDPYGWIASSSVLVGHLLMPLVSMPTLFVPKVPSGCFRHAEMSDGTAGWAVLLKQKKLTVILVCLFPRSREMPSIDSVIGCCAVLATARNCDLWEILDGSATFGPTPLLWRSRHTETKKDFSVGKDGESLVHASTFWCNDSGGRNDPLWLTLLISGPIRSNSRETILQLRQDSCFNFNVKYTRKVVRCRIASFTFFRCKHLHYVAYHCSLWLNDMYYLRCISSLKTSDVEWWDWCSRPSRGVF